MFFAKRVFLCFLVFSILVLRNVGSLKSNEHKNLSNPDELNSTGGGKDETNKGEAGKGQNESQTEPVGDVQPIEGVKKGIGKTETQNDVVKETKEEDDEYKYIMEKILGGDKGENLNENHIVSTNLSNKQEQNVDLTANTKKLNDIIQQYYKNVLVPRIQKKREEEEKKKKENEKSPLITRIKKFFKKEDEKIKTPTTIIDYIREKDKKILKLEEKNTSMNSRETIYKRLFWATAYVLFNIALVPLIGYLYVSKTCKDTIMKEYENNKDRRIVPYNYDFGDDRPNINFMGMNFQNCKHYFADNARKSPFLIGMVQGDPYAIIKL
ncbi:hypothetical protein, conserved [Plasmodium gonderi]|uniref:Variable surface protein n=1 Tax=Plasmodium gonderi TaxID=77519 RepID=A0A1Y1JGG7_PLAGO|nr:hypothetical protein, conserved [Plasmodium gonderi]GAW79852.1 hypothetical protein, conserved [Plasmodium gonderi]